MIIITLYRMTESLIRDCNIILNDQMHIDNHLEYKKIKETLQKVLKILDEYYE